MAEFLGGEAASLREAPLPPDPSLPKSGWRLGWDDSSELVPPERWEWFPASWLSPRRLTEPPRTCGVGGRGNWIQEKLMACAIGFSCIGVWRCARCKKGGYPPLFAERMAPLLLRKEARECVLLYGLDECQRKGVSSVSLSEVHYSASGIVNL